MWLLRGLASGIGAIGFACVAQAGPGGVFDRLCIFEIPRELPPALGPIFPGCEVVDCCPGCPGPPLLDWRIRFEGGPLETISLDFARMPAEQIKKLQILKGNAQWVTPTQLRVGKGETLIRGFTQSAGAAQPAIVPRATIDDATKQRLIAAKNAFVAAQNRTVQSPIPKVRLRTKAAADQADTGSADIGRVTLAIDQLIGPLIVNRYGSRWGIRLCPDGSSRGGTEDTITLRNNTGGDNAVVLLDGRRSGGVCMDDQVYRPSTSVGVGNVLSNTPGCTSEVIVLSNDNAMQWQTPTTWTDAPSDDQAINLAPGLLNAPVTFWVMQGPFATTQARVVVDMVRANQLYNTMNCGVSFNTTVINNATANANTPALINANCGQLANLRTQIGYTAGQLNVYYLNNPGARGWSCGGDRNVVIIGAGADNESLAHEFGHAFTLAHTNTVAGMSPTNLMVTGGTGRNNITEGQCFRVNANPGSMLNVNGVRTGPTRTCADGTTGRACPALSLDVVPNR